MHSWHQRWFGTNEQAASTEPRQSLLVRSMDKQEFLILGKNAKGRALCELISRATAEPGMHTFGELLHLQSVQEVVIDCFRCLFKPLNLSINMYRHRSIHPF